MAPAHRSGSNWDLVGRSLTGSLTWGRSLPTLWLTGWFCSTSTLQASLWGGTRNCRWSSCRNAAWPRLTFRPLLTFRRDACDELSPSRTAGTRVQRQVGGAICSQGSRAASRGLRDRGEPGSAERSLDHTSRDIRIRPGVSDGQMGEGVGGENEGQIEEKDGRRQMSCSSQGRGQAVQQQSVCCFCNYLLSVSSWRR